MKNYRLKKTSNNKTFIVNKNCHFFYSFSLILSHVKASDLEVVSQHRIKPTIFFIFQNNHQHEPLPGDL